MKDRQLIDTKRKRERATKKRQRQTKKEKDRMREWDNRGNIYLNLKIINCHSIDIRAIQTIREVI